MVNDPDMTPAEINALLRKLSPSGNGKGVLCSLCGFPVNFYNFAGVDSESHAVCNAHFRRLQTLAENTLKPSLLPYFNTSFWLSFWLWFAIGFLVVFACLV